MVFCNTEKYKSKDLCICRHNPYFNRWFSAISGFDWDKPFIDWVTILILIDGFLQYRFRLAIQTTMPRHNPYFNRWFSAIGNFGLISSFQDYVTILILIDGFLQYRKI